MLDPHPLPWTNYHALQSVTAQTSGSTLLWECNLDPIGPRAEIERLIQDLGRQAFDTLNNLLSHNKTGDARGDE